MKYIFHYTHTNITETTCCITYYFPTFYFSLFTVHLLGYDFKKRIPNPLLS